MLKSRIILALVMLILAGGFIFTIQKTNFSTSFKQREKAGQQGISSGEKELIEAWIQKNDLNEYGDSRETVYTGGTPLFDEATGEKVDKYEYVLRNHADRPWTRI